MTIKGWIPNSVRAPGKVSRIPLLWMSDLNIRIAKIIAIILKEKDFLNNWIDCLKVNFFEIIKRIIIGGTIKTMDILNIRRVSIKRITGQKSTINCQMSLFFDGAAFFSPAGGFFLIVFKGIIKNKIPVIK